MGKSQFHLRHRHRHKHRGNVCHHLERRTDGRTTCPKSRLPISVVNCPASPWEIRNRRWLCRCRSSASSPYPPFDFAQFSFANLLTNTISTGVLLYDIYIHRYTGIQVYYIIYIFYVSMCYVYVRVCKCVHKRKSAHTSLAASWLSRHRHTSGKHQRGTFTI